MLFCLHHEYRICYYYFIKGIPYAEQPERFTKSVPKAKWTTVLNATEYTASCPQIIQPEFQGAVPYEISEDCLGLNVFAPNQTVRVAKIVVNVVSYWRTDELLNIGQ